MAVSHKLSEARHVYLVVHMSINDRHPPRLALFSQLLWTRPCLYIHLILAYMFFVGRVFTKNPLCMGIKLLVLDAYPTIMRWDGVGVILLLFLSQGVQPARAAYSVFVVAMLFGLLMASRPISGYSIDPYPLSN